MAHGDSKRFMVAKIAALQRARRKIANQETSYICWALENVQRQVSDINIAAAASKLMEYISNQLEGEGALDSWIVKNRRQLSPLRNYGDYSTIMRDYRVQWIDWMIGDLKAQLGAQP